ncbi:MAG: AraC family transcriptional regulator [Cyanobacteria bacterium P01_A01_bin.40]
MNLPVLSHFNPKSRQKILPQKPLISALDLGWQSFNFDYYEHDSHETPIYLQEHHTIALSLSEIKTERKLDGRYRQEQQYSGSVAIIPATFEHWCVWKKTGKFAVLSIKPDALAKIAPETVNPEHIELLPKFSQPESDYFITGLVMGIKQQLEINPEGCDFYAEHLKNALFAHLIQNYCSLEYRFKDYDDGLPPYKLKQALNYINDHLDETIKLKDIADLLDISQYYFCRLFRNSIGVSPYRYVIQQRVDKAKKLMANSNLPLSDIAFECGFSSQSQMTQHFSKLVGVTPKKYRNLL